MRTARGLFRRLLDPDHLDVAAARTVRGKRRRRDVAWFLFRRQAELERLRAELAAGRYRPSPLELISIRDPKPRVIARLSVADRVVQTAMVLLMEPALTRGLMPEAYACREGYGTHRARLRLLELMRRHRFVVHLDVRSYFPSIDTGILFELLAARLRDDRFLALVARGLEHGRGIYDEPRVRRLAGLGPDWPPPGRGLPVGSYTSQLYAAHVYLQALDHMVKRALRAPGYVRYVDDLFLFGDRRADLRAWREAVGGWLRDERRLRLKHPQARVLSCRGHLDALGARITRDGLAPRPRTVRRLRRRIVRALRRNDAADAPLARSLAARADLLLG